MPRTPVTSEMGPFAIVPEWLIYSGVSGRAIHLYCVLARHADNEHVATPSRRRIGELLDCSKDTIDRAIDELVKAGALSVTPRFDEAGDRTSNAYLVRQIGPKRQGTPLPTGGRNTSATGGRASHAVNESPSEREPSSKASAPPDAPQPGVQTRPAAVLVAHYVDRYRAAHHGYDPARSLRAACGQQVKGLLREGYDPDHLRACLSAIAREGKRPSVLPLVLSDYHATEAP